MSVLNGGFKQQVFGHSMTVCRAWHPPKKPKPGCMTCPVRLYLDKVTERKGK